MILLTYSTAINNFLTVGKYRVGLVINKTDKPSSKDRVPILECVSLHHSLPKEEFRSSVIPNSLYLQAVSE